MLANKKTILFFVSEDWYFVSHRIDLAIEAKKRGYRVVVYTNISKHEQRLKAEGFIVISAKISRGVSILCDIKTSLNLLKIIKAEKVDLVHAVALKPSLTAAIVLFLNARIKKIYAISGLGSVFTEKSIKFVILKNIILLFINHFLNRKNSKIIVQNKEDYAFLSKYVTEKKLTLIRGAGVDIDKFKPKQEKNDGNFKVLMASRIMWSKGVLEYSVAAKQLCKKYPYIKFDLLGKLDVGNTSSLKDDDVKYLEKNYGIFWGGEIDDMSSKFQEYEIFVLPTYYGEGVPKVIIEACSCGLPVVTTNSPGCNDIVQNEHNGLLVSPRNTQQLIQAIESLVISKDKRRRMGTNGRDHVIKFFSKEKILNETFEIYESI